MVISRKITLALRLGREGAMRMKTTMKKGIMLDLGEHSGKMFLSQSLVWVKVGGAP